MTLNECLTDLISDMKDYIDDYKWEINHTDSRIKKEEYKIRIDELRKWKDVIETIKYEQE